MLAIMTNKNIPSEAQTSLMLLAYTNPARKNTNGIR